MTVKRFMYYSPWCIVDAANIASGLAYSGRDENSKPQFTQVVGVNIYALETGTTPVTMMANWNHSICQWLKYYVQLRMTKPKEK